MRIGVEKAADGTFIIDVPRKPKKDKQGNKLYQEDLRYTAKNIEKALTVIKKVLMEVETPNDEYEIAFDEAVKEG